MLIRGFGFCLLQLFSFALVGLVRLDRAGFYLRPQALQNTVDDISCITVRTLNYDNYGIFLIMGNA